MWQAINGMIHGTKWTSQSRLTDLNFADDISLLAETSGTLQDMTTNLETEAGKVRVRISANKTKVMQVGEVKVLQPVTVGRQNVDDVDHFTYLSSILACDGDAEADGNCRISKMASVFQRIRSIWSTSVISTDTKIWLYKAIVMSIGIYVSETWKITTKIAHKLNVFHQQCLRKILHVTCRDHVTNRSPAENWLKETGRYCNRAQIPLGRTHTASTKPSTFEGCNVMEMMAVEEEDVQRRHGAEHSRKT